MGLDLKLIPVDCDSVKQAWGHTLLTLDRDRGLWEAIKRVPSMEFRRDFNCYVADIPDGKWGGESGYGNVTEDALGEPLSFVYADELGRVVDLEIMGEKSPHNVPAFAYIKALPKNTKVILYWC